MSSTSSPASGTFGTSGLINDDEVLVVQPPPVPASVQVPHPVVSATMAHFDGSMFNIDGSEYELKDIKVDYLRKFCRSNDVRMTEPPHKTLRTGTRLVVIEEIKAKKGRIVNSEPDPWSKDKDKADKKPAWVNRYRLANVVFSEECRPFVAERGKSLTREELDLGMKTDQKVYEKVAAEYNKIGVDAYDDIQYSFIQITGSRNMPYNFDSITWQDAKKATKECINNLEKARKNLEISGTHDSDIEDASEHNGMKIGPFTNMHHVVYWNLFAEDHGDIFLAFTGELDGSVFDDSMSTKPADNSKKKRKQNDMVEMFKNSVDVDSERLAIDNRRNELLLAQVEANERQAEANHRQAAAMEYSARTENIHRLTQDHLALQQKKEQCVATLREKCGGRKDFKKRFKEHNNRKVGRQVSQENDDDYSSVESNASLMDEWEQLSSRLKILEAELTKQYEKHYNSNSNNDSNVSTT
jgi:hypothetical protein